MLAESRAYYPKSELIGNKPEMIQPELIQGGMAVRVSDWKLARAVALAGEKLDRPVLGVVSGTGLPLAMVSRVRQGDPDTIRVLNAFPIPEISQRIFERYGNSRKMLPKPQVLLSGKEDMQTLMADLLVVSNFVEVFLAKEGHNQPIGINYLEKVQMPHLPEMLGAMLAGVDYVLMGAGIPDQVPSVLDNFANLQKAKYKIDVKGLKGGYEMSFDPSRYIPENTQKLNRPKFLAIISSHILAQFLANKVGGIDGFVVEGPKAGGHNAPARGNEVNEQEEPVYGEKDKPDLSKIQKLGLPFWLAGGFAGPEELKQAQESGAVGVQVGSAFAACEESGFREDIKGELREKTFDGTLIVVADRRASPAGVPFQIARLEGTALPPSGVCKYGYLTNPFVDEKGELDYRCPAEKEVFVRRGGKQAETEGKLCLCAGLNAAVDPTEDGAPIVTFGKDHSFAPRLMRTRGEVFSAEDVVRSIFAFPPRQD